MGTGTKELKNMTREPVINCNVLVEMAFETLAFLDAYCRRTDGAKPKDSILDHLEGEKFPTIAYAFYRKRMILNLCLFALAARQMTGLCKMKIKDEPCGQFIRHHSWKKGFKPLHFRKACNALIHAVRLDFYDLSEEASIATLADNTRKSIPGFFPDTADKEKRIFTGIASLKSEEDGELSLTAMLDCFKFVRRCIMLFSSCMTDREEASHEDL